MGLIGTIGSNISQAYNTSCQLLNQGYQSFAQTAIGKHVDAVARPAITWIGEKTPESIKNRSFVYGAGAMWGVRIFLYWKNDTANNHLEEAARCATREDGNGGRAIEIRECKI